jgi:hypothetical protein
MAPLLGDGNTNYWDCKFKPKPENRPVFWLFGGTRAQIPEQSRVLDFALELKRKRQLSGKELSALAQRMVDSNDPTEVERLKSKITHGFYGD